MSGIVSHHNQFNSLMHSDQNNIILVVYSFFTYIIEEIKLPKNFISLRSLQIMLYERFKN